MHVLGLPSQQTIKVNKLFVVSELIIQNQGSVSALSTLSFLYEPVSDHYLV